MRATLTVAVPFVICVPEGATFPVYQFQRGDTRVTPLPPRKLAAGGITDDRQSVTIEGKQAFQADALQFDFFKDQFDRRIEVVIDPPEDLIQSVLDGFVRRLRFATQAPQIKAFRLQDTTWRIEYRNDDGTELPQQDGLCRARFGQRFTLSATFVDAKLWDYLFNSFGWIENRPWQDLLLDAQESGASIGNMIVLSQTALEVFISELLETLAAESSVPPALWKWMNNRHHTQQNPSVADEFDVLLKVLCGHSLKEEEALWESFMHLKEARNTFVHNGTAAFGGGKIPVDQPKAAALVRATKEITEKIRSWVPENIRWPDPPIGPKGEVSKQIFPVAG